MRFPLTRSGRTKSTHGSTWFPESQHQHPVRAEDADTSTDLPLSPQPLAPQASAPRAQPTLHRSASVSERFSSQYSGDRRSIAIFPSGDQSSYHYDPPTAFDPDDFGHPSPPTPSGGLGRSHTVLVRREGSARNRNTSPLHDGQQYGSPSPLWSPDFVRLPTPSERPEPYYDDVAAAPLPSPLLVTDDFGHAPMTGGQYSAGKTSSDSGQSTTLDRWSQRRLQRLNTEQGFREQRQGGGSILSPPPVGEQQHHFALQQQQQQQQQAPVGYTSTAGGVPSTYSSPEPQLSGQPLHQQPQPQPHPPQAPAYQSPRTVQTHVPSPQPQYSPPDSGSSHPSQDAARPQVSQSRSYTQQSQPSSGGPEDPSMPNSNNVSLPAPKPLRTGGSNRQSMHNGLALAQQQQQQQQQQAQQQGVPAFSTSVVPPTSQTHRGQQQGDVGRITPQPQQGGEEMSDEDVAQLIKDHKELREKYTKVKKYYFEKEDQVKQLQNSLAHQRLSQSRTSLDDSEYTTRFNRLDGLVAQLAFSIRKSWRSVPQWLERSVNKDAVATGKQEMTAVGRSLISCWLVDEVFNKYFHPDLDPSLSAQLKNVQLNIRRFAPPCATVEEEDSLTSKVVNWRLATLEGLQDALRSPQCPQNRLQLTDSLKERLIGALSVYLQDPPPSDLEGGVHMIIELVVSIAIHLPLESRDVVIEYFTPGYSLLSDQMKAETGIPSLGMSVADEAAERASLRSTASDVTEMTENGGQSQHGDGSSSTKKRSMLSALTGNNSNKGTKPSSAAQGKHAGAGGSSSSLTRPESAHGMKEDMPPRVRMAAGIGVQVRGRSVLVKAPVFST